MATKPEIEFIEGPAPDTLVITDLVVGDGAEAVAGGRVEVLESEDKEAAKEIHRKTLRMYLTLPNYRNYWKAAGYEAEAIEALAEGVVDLLKRRSGR